MPSMMSCATCSRIRWPRPILPSGLIRGFIMPMDFQVLRKGIFMSIPRPAKSSKPPMRLSIRNRMPASFNPIEDDLVNEGGIMDLWVREARLFKYGSGTGTNFSKLRGDGEPLSGGGRSSGLMSFLRIGDRAAGAIKSGGTTRRAAKMVCLDLDHPDIEEFINWKVVEEQKVAAMVTGSKICAQRLNAVLKACHVVDGAGQM